MKLLSILIALVTLVGIASYAVFAQDEQPRQSESSMGGMMGGGMMSGGQRAWEAPSSAAGRQNPVPADRTSIAAGRALFDQYYALTDKSHKPRFLRLTGSSMTRISSEMYAGGDILECVPR
jgi:hypothetical protein